MVNRGVFIFRLLQKNNREKVYNMNGILFDRKSFIVKPWSFDISFDKARLTSIPIWVKLPKLNLKYWSKSILKRLTGYLGVVLKIDEETRSRSRMCFARILVEMNVKEEFSEELFYSNEYKEIVSQPVHYDWISIWCSKCSQYGHNVADCRMRKQKASNPELQVDDEGFRPLRKGFRKVSTTALGGSLKKPSPVAASNQQHVRGEGGYVQQVHRWVLLNRLEGILTLSNRLVFSSKTLRAYHLLCYRLVFLTMIV